MADIAFVDIRSLNDLENGIHSFDHQMSETHSEIEHLIDLYFHDFEWGLRKLEERLRDAEYELERAKIALERKRNERVWVKDKDGKGHWEQADCSSEERAVARCEAKRDKCLRDVEECRRMIYDAKSRRNWVAERYSLIELRRNEAIAKLGKIKELLERRCHIFAPPSFSPVNPSHSIPSSRSAFTAPSEAFRSTSIPKGSTTSRPRSPMNNNQSYGPKASPLSERPRKPMNENVNPIPNSTKTEAERPHPPFGYGERITRDSVSSFREGVDKILKKYKDENPDE